ncbi:AraC family transcriptional regulator [Pseudomonas aeruginosa]|uniref:AraC family transcriptional regulator n=1 Tax=Pseudomonas aeruginosa TaxID=287 RepID=UPI000BB862F0|nr:AraC family transcriptional regulator [Pseudomonas aeruginosa]PBZ54973.1 AraC family transcriptional regulator [Pseudomonas aeruginosa]PBZ54975.1 AraC family transcriptional regulator [Pseudomonas aeruginosa]PBZ60714.1 AraC family transcriptional regulator [Pseudomonas aeruginosa]PBZ60716.1 AraC family transcriptional regulator [Pseudomonas aeruginosa]PBZ67633.1 AraC family transcriptional regulator [Pseudomonas aeruginosa]
MKSVRTVVSENFFRRFRETFSPYLLPLGIDTRVLERPDIEIPGEQYLALWEAAGKANANIGLELGMQTEPDDFGALGHATHCAPSVEKVLRTLQQFIVVFAQESTVQLQFDSRTVSVEYQVTAPTIIQRRQDAEFAIAAMLRQLSLITECTIKPIRIDFEHSKPADITAHKHIFQCPIYFSQPANRLCLSIDTLQLPVARGNERLYKALEPYLEKERQQRSVSDELLPQITRIVAAEMSSGAPSIDEICDQLNLSRRTLQRRLKEHGIEFSTLIEDIRRELAISYMKESNYSMTEISLLVGYSESASFTRAFRRWTGQSPQQYRAAHLAS